MSRIEKTFSALKSEGKTALIPYVTAGDREPSWTVSLMHALVEAGADVLEVGVPFSDPMADGPAIQKACERALLHGVSLSQVLDIVAEFRRSDNSTPVVLMGYLNPIERMGYETFAHRAGEVGVDGVLTVDLPPEEGASLTQYLKPLNIDPIFLVAPTSTEARIQSIADLASGFIYYVSLKGVTGAANLDRDAVKAKLAQIRQHTSLPLGVGFGIRDAETAAAMAECGDAVVVGSALVNLIGDSDSLEAAQAAVSALLSEIRQAIDA
ncbi:tryptophan synthase, alpha subunit [gamma proteobacterium HTCC5015]|nr:tryptophan synthase, alpha subunit [gamma proteobacterium HTCC5015]